MNGNIQGSIIREYTECDDTDTDVKSRKLSGRKAYFAIKRLFDITASLCALIILLPLLIIIALLIICEDGGRPLFVHTRVGKNGRPVGIYKFRSMKENAEKLEDSLTEEELEEYRINFKLDDDKRITRIGKILRKTSLDELPQLINIIKGEMSVVGPRPVLQEETELYGDDRDKLLSMRPGLTGYWQAYARNNVGYEDHRRQDMELYYIDNCSVWLDIKILFRTVGAVLSRSGAK